MHAVIERLKGALIASCQAYPGEPLRHPETMAQMARACELGGAAAIRCQGLADIAAIKGRVEVPVIGLWKEGHEGVYITPTLRHARACVAAGADIVAIDATDRPRPDGRTSRRPSRPCGAPTRPWSWPTAPRSRISGGRWPPAPTSCRPRSPTVWRPSTAPWPTGPTCPATPGGGGVPGLSRRVRGSRPYPSRRARGHRCRRLGRRGGDGHHPSHEHHELVRGRAAVGTAVAAGVRGHASIVPSSV